MKRGQKTMGFMKKIVDSLKLSDDSDYDDYDDYDDYIAAEEEKKRKKEEKKQEKAKEPRTSIKEMLFKKKTPEQNAGYQDGGYEEDPTMYQQNVQQTYQQPVRRPLYDNNTVSIQERRSGYMNGTTTFADRYKAKEAARYGGQQQAAPVNRQPQAQTQRPILPVMPQQAPMQKTVKDALGVTILKPQSFEDAREICDNLIDGNPIIVNLEGFDTDRSQRLMDFVSGCVYAIGANLHQISSYIFIISPADVDVTGDYNALMRRDGFGVPTFNKR